MKKLTLLKPCILALTATLALATTVNAQQRTLSEDIAARQTQTVAATVTTPPAPAQPNTLQNAIQSGKASIDARLRYEFVDQEGYDKNANAITLRTRLGYTTAPYYGLDAGIMAENVVALVDNYYDSVAPLPPGAAKSEYPTVMDPETTEVNQAWLRYTAPADTGIATQATFGRQRILLDNTRFVGDVGWRQDNQTFDAISVKNTIVKNLTINYGWLWRVNRVQGDQRDWRSNSHLINLSYASCQYATLTAYGYLLDFHSPAAAIAATANAASNKTFGASLAGNPALTKDIKLNYRLEYARQNNYGHNHTDYSTHYLAAELGATTLAKYNLTLGCEQLASDNGQGFRTPLGTNHAFNGWSDFILPVGNNFPDGLRDYYVKASVVLPANLQLIAYYHKFDTDRARRAYGDEIDASLAYRLNKNIAFLVKGALFNGKNGQPDHLNKFWLQTEYAF